MDNLLKTACIQLTGGPEIEENLKRLGGMIREAAGCGARLIATPENSDMMLPQADGLKAARTAGDHPGLPFFSTLAKELGVWLLIGSVKIRVAPDRLVNRSYLFDADGSIAAFYDKIHLFDVDLPTGEVHRESATIQPGDKAVLADTPWGKIGLSICYDLRFAGLYRALAQAGARILTVPAAFTVPTGQAHWETLLRARAIETGSFVLAPAQTGAHAGGRRTWGHSLIVSPWGEVLADGGTEQGVIIADLDMEAVARARAAIPALKHDRRFETP